MAPLISGGCLAACKTWAVTFLHLRWMAYNLPDGARPNRDLGMSGGDTFPASKTPFPSASPVCQGWAACSDVAASSLGRIFFAFLV